jgi:hypothetical protein
VGVPRRKGLPGSRTADAVADVVAMLATNGYITGQTLNVDDVWYMS